LIDIRLLSDSKGRLIELEALGHAGQIVKGENIVCAAVSVLLEALAAGLSEIVKAATVERDDGLIRIRISPEPATELLCAATLLTLNRIQAQYPDEVKITVSGGAA